MVKSTIPRPPVHRITAVQLVSALAVSGGMLLTGNTVDSYSLLVGCLIQIVGTAYFAFRAFRYAGAKQMPAAVGQMYRGQSGKFFLSAALFALVFAFVRPINVVLIFVGYISMQAVQVTMAAAVTRR